MTCKEVENRLPAYPDNILSPEEKKHIEEHLASCPRCAKALADLQKTGEQLRELDEMEPPPFFKQKVMARVREEARQKEGIVRKLFYPLYIKVPMHTLATVLVAVLAFYIYRTSEPQFKNMPPTPIPIFESGKNQDTTETLGKAVKVPPVPTPLKKQPGKMKEHEILKLPEPQTASESLEQKAKGSGSSDRMIASEYRSSGASPPAPRLKASAAGQPLILNVTIRVQEVNSAVEKIENILAKFKAHIIEEKIIDGKRFLTVEIQARQTRALVEELKKTGEVGAMALPTETGEEKAAIKIEIISIRP